MLLRLTGPCRPSSGQRPVHSGPHWGNLGTQLPERFAALDADRTAPATAAAPPPSIQRRTRLIDALSWKHEAGSRGYLKSGRIGAAAELPPAVLPRHRGVCAQNRLGRLIPDGSLFPRIDPGARPPRVALLAAAGLVGDPLRPLQSHQPVGDGADAFVKRQANTNGPIPNPI